MIMLKKKWTCWILSSESSNLLLLAILAGQVQLSQNRAGGAAGVYGDFAPTQHYQSVGSPMYNDASPALQLPSKERSNFPNESLGCSVRDAVEDITLQATQPAPPLEDTPQSAALQSSTLSPTLARDTVHQPPPPALATCPEQQPASKVLHQNMPGSSIRRSDSSPSLSEQPVHQKQLEQKSNSSKMMTRQSPENQERGSRLHLPASSPTTSYPSTATAVRQKSRLSMATNSHDDPPSHSPHWLARQPVISEEAEEGDGWNEADVIWGRPASDGSGLAFCGTMAEMAEWEASKEVKATVPSYLQQDLQNFSTSIASFPQYAGLNEVGLSAFRSCQIPQRPAGFRSSHMPKEEAKSLWEAYDTELPEMTPPIRQIKSESVKRIASVSTGRLLWIVTSIKHHSVKI